MDNYTRSINDLSIDELVNLAQSLHANLHEGGWRFEQCLRMRAELEKVLIVAIGRINWAQAMVISCDTALLPHSPSNGYKN